MELLTGIGVMLVGGAVFMTGLVLLSRSERNLSEPSEIVSPAGPTEIPLVGWRLERHHVAAVHVRH